MRASHSFSRHMGVSAQRRPCLQDPLMTPNPNNIATMTSAQSQLTSPTEDRGAATIFSNLPIGLYRATVTGQIVAANKTLLQMFDSESLKELNDTFEALGFELVCQRKEFQEQLKTLG